MQMQFKLYLVHGLSSIGRFSSFTYNAFFFVHKIYINLNIQCFQKQKPQKLARFMRFEAKRTLL